MIEVRTGCRLHFGLLSFPGPHQEGAPARRFGGVGLMVREPGVVLRARLSGEWSVRGPLAERALAMAQQVGVPAGAAPLDLTVEHAPPEHVGLGTGTQLALAVARAVALLNGWKDVPLPQLAQRVGRGRRSSLGIHGYAHGGFLVEAGKGAPDRVSPLVARAEMPSEWRILLALPSQEAGLHGGREERVFAELLERGMAQSRTEALCRLVLLGMLPALVEGDRQAFGEALFEFNALAGEVFSPIQGGVYGGPRVAELVAFLRREGVAGVGQSSWGPGVFAVTAGEEEARWLARRVLQEPTLQVAEVLVGRPANRGATEQVLP